MAAAAAVGRGGRCWSAMMRCLQQCVMERGGGVGLVAAGRHGHGGDVAWGLQEQGRGALPPWNMGRLGGGVRWMSAGHGLRVPGVVVEDEGEEEEEEQEGEEGDGGGEKLSVQGAEGSLQSQILNAPRRKRRFLFEKALKIRTVQGPQFMGDKMEMKVIDVNRTCKVTKGGGILHFTAFVICGNNNGVVGFGKGKSNEVATAVDKAYLRATSNLHYFERFEGHTIPGEHSTKYGKTKVYLWPAKNGAGLRGSNTVGGILRLAGFKDVKTKIVGSRHPHNTVKAVFKALSEIGTGHHQREQEHEME